MTWQQFRKEFEVSRHDLSESRRTFTKATLSQFERISRPKRLNQITAQTLERYAAQRGTEGVDDRCRDETAHDGTEHREAMAVHSRRAEGTPPESRIEGAVVHLGD